MSLIDDLFGQMTEAASGIYEEGYLLIGSIVLLVVVTYFILRSAGAGWALGAFVTGGGFIVLAIVLLGGDE